MLPVPINVPTHHLSFVGTERILILPTPVDPRQFWLPFVQAIVPLEDVSPPPSTVSEKIEQTIAAFCPPTLRLHHPPARRDVPQYVIPFREARLISNSVWKTIKKADYPVWDRTPTTDRHGNTVHVLCEVSVSADYMADAKAWCAAMCVHRYRLRRHRFTFERIDEAVHFRCLFG